MKIEEVNKLDYNEFEIFFGNIVECFSKVACELYSKIPFENLDTFLKESEKVIENLSVEEKKIVLQCHPDLAGKLFDAGKLTNESTHEQKLAGLDKLTLEIKTELNNLNEKYKSKFGFPFVICVRENKTQAILNGLQKRFQHDQEQELLVGIDEVKKICKLRIKDIIQN